MKPRAYYNEIDKFAAAWLRNLIAGGHIADGDVDERSIEDVRPSDLSGYTQCHFFAGIGGWSYALRLAGWPDDRPVWTGSCPCQPFSVAGQRTGFADERHLWPKWFWLIQQSRPDTVFGEQVEAAIRQHWLDLVQADLEGISYACGTAGFPAAGIGAPHIRQRLYFAADLLGNPIDSGLQGFRRPVNQHDPSGREGTQRHGPTSGFWSNAEWVYCRDEKYRPIEPGTFPLAHGATNRVGRLRGYGSAIVAPQAEAFVRAYLDCTGNGQ